ncbi:MAG: sulfatase-like hydrolase/transferase [Myxococcales bacterium]|nr:sulfatase-like hydrolase/transferase [Myxococcales bacterium]
MMATARRFIRFIRPPLLIAALAFVFDLAFAFRVSYMGATDDKVSALVVDELLGFVIRTQAEIITLLVLVAATLWAISRGLLGLPRRRAYAGVAATWVLLMLAHCRRWPAVYADLRDIRPIPDAVFLSVTEGIGGIALMAALAAVLIWQTVRALPHPMPWTRWPRLVAGVALIAGLFHVAGRAPQTPEWRRQPSTDPARPDVLFLMTDSWRADHFECRADSALTPRLGALCQRYGSHHYDAYASQPRTFGSVASIFTGLDPDQSGVRHMMAAAADRDLRDRSLTARFTAAGYRTVAVSGFAGDVFPRVALGFETLDTPTFGFEVVVREFSYRAHPLLLPFFSTNRLGREHLAPVYRTFMDLADPDLEVARAYDLAAEPDPRPLFLTVFLSTTHSPYAVHSGHAHRRGDDPVVARYRWHPPSYRKTIVDPALYPAIAHRYADAVQTVDATLATLAEQALARGNTLVIITSDHGELLYEFGEGNHGDHIFGPQQLAVPVVVLDGREGIPPAPVPAATTPPPIHALKHTLQAAVQAIETRTPFTLPTIDHHFAESGIIISALGPHVIEGYRLDYPELLDLLDLDRATRDMVVQPRFAHAVEVGKFRLMITPEWAFAYVPGCRKPRMSMLPRAEQVRALPSDSLGAAHPDAIEAAWAAMRQRWGPDLVRRDRCGLLD